MRERIGIKELNKFLVNCYVTCKLTENVDRKIMLPILNDISLLWASEQNFGWLSKEG